MTMLISTKWSSYQTMLFLEGRTNVFERALGLLGDPQSCCGYDWLSLLAGD